MIALNTPLLHGSQLDTPLSMARKLNLHRERLGVRPRLPEMAFASYRKYFEVPSVVEGFAEVRAMQFEPKFASETERSLFERYGVGADTK